MSDHTRLGCVLWSWEPFIRLGGFDGGTEAQMLWLGLYTTPEAKRIAPGLWSGSIRVMAEAIKKPADVVVRALDKLLDHEMVEFDQSASVLRLCMLPDAGEGPQNGNVIRGWWRRFRTVPQCAVRDAHVPLLRWLLDESARQNPKSRTGRPSVDHETAWGETFGHPTMGIPELPARRRGVRRLCDNDTGTATQPGLFDAARSASRSSSSVGVETVSNHSLEASESRSPENTKCNDSAGPEIISKQTGSGSGIGSGLGIPDPEGQGQGMEPDRPRLALVPMPHVAYTPETLVDALVRGAGVTGLHEQIVPTSLRAPMGATIADLVREGVGPPEIAVVGRRMGARVREMLARWPDCPRNEIIAQWAGTRGLVLAELEAHREHQRLAAERSAMLREAMGSVPL